MSIVASALVSFHAAATSIASAPGTSTATAAHRRAVPGDRVVLNVAPESAEVVAFVNRNDRQLVPESSVPTCVHPDGVEVVDEDERADLVERRRPLRITAVSSQQVFRVGSAAT